MKTLLIFALLLPAGASASEVRRLSLELVWAVTPNSVQIDSTTRLFKRADEALANTIRILGGKPASSRTIAACAGLRSVYVVRLENGWLVSYWVLDFPVQRSAYFDLGEFEVEFLELCHKAPEPDDSEADPESVQHQACTSGVAKQQPGTWLAKEAR